jgi:WD40 repeat protein
VTAPLRPISGASLGLAPAASTTENLAFELPQHERYTDGGVIGRGGMGEIRSVHDGRLGRTIALKVPVDRNPGAARQLLAEATLTARLAHPGIVAIHDAGCTADGRPYYTMPIVHGHSLAEAIAGASASERLKLVRHFLDACDAIAYAHSQGVLHRDIKPSNILVGRFGETVVVDWGLAGPVGVAARSIVGTPQYMPPEQARGEPLDPSADVYALGITLREILTGAPRGQPDSSTPPELLAIVERATRASPTARYADGRELAQDVSAWFEGRRVLAHRYRLRELLARVWAAHRVSLTIALLAIVAVAVAAAVGYRRTAFERARAQASEQVALAARERSDRSLAQVEVAQALGAMAQGSWPEAELFAAGALMHGPSVAARGVLARFDPSVRPRLVQRGALSHCARMAVSSRGERIACASDGVIRIVTPSSEHSAPTLDVRGDPVVVVGEGSGVVVDSPGVGLVLVNLHNQRTTTLQAVGSSPRAHSSSDVGELGWVSGISELWSDVQGRVEMTSWCSDHGDRVPGVVGVRPDGTRIVVCQDGVVLMMNAHEGTRVRELMRLPSSLGGPLVLALSQSDHAAVGLAGGTVVVVGLDDGRIIRTFTSDAGTPFDLALSNTRLALSDGRGSVYVWELASGALVVRLSAQAARVRWIDDGRTLRVIGRAIEDWSLPASQVRPHVRASGVGIAALSVSLDGRHVITAHGDGRVRLSRTDGSGPLVEIPLCIGVVKDVEISPDGRHAAAVCAQDHRLHIIDLDDPQVPESQRLRSSARVVWLDGGRMLLAPYEGALLALHEHTLEPSPQPRPHVRVIDLESDPDRRFATALEIDGRILRLSAQPGSSARIVAERPGALAVAGSESVIAVVTNSTLEILRNDGEPALVSLPDVPITELALSPDGERVALGAGDGSVWVWSTSRLEPIAMLRGHQNRVSSLAFDGTGEWLLTGSWDADLRHWSMRALEQSPASLLAEAEAAWGLGLDELLERQTGEGRGM